MIMAQMYKLNSCFYYSKMLKLFILNVFKVRLCVCAHYCSLAGFGNSLAQRLDSLGFTVIAGCLDKSSDGAEQLKSSTSGRLHVIPLDVTDDTGISNCLSFFEEELPGKGTRLPVFFFF